MLAIIRYMLIDSVKIYSSALPSTLGTYPRPSTFVNKESVFELPVGLLGSVTKVFLFEC